jgi:photosynthetic reaction center H subunit
VYGCDGLVAGTVVDTWIDRSEYIARYLEVETTAAYGARRVLLPMHFVRVRSKEAAIKVKAITAAQFATVPAHMGPDSVSMRDEDKISAYYAGGLLYATPGRKGPLL